MAKRTKADERWRGLDTREKVIQALEHGEPMQDRAGDIDVEADWGEVVLQNLPTPREHAEDPYQIRAEYYQDEDGSLSEINIRHTAFGILVSWYREGTCTIYPRPQGSGLRELNIWGPVIIVQGRDWVYRCCATGDPVEFGDMLWPDGTITRNQYTFAAGEEKQDIHQLIAMPNNTRWWKR